MFINKDSVKIDGVSMGKYLVEAEYHFHKLWGPDSSRNLAGTMSGTLVGIFPKLVIHFRALNKDELEIIAPLLDKATQSTLYYDPKKKSNVTMSTYASDYVYNVRSAGRAEGFQVSLISRKKRS